MACRWGFISFCVSGSHRLEPCGSMIGLEAWVHRFESCGFSGRSCEVFLLGAWSFESCVVCFKSFEVIPCVALDLGRVLCASPDVACIVLHLALRPSDNCRSSCYQKPLDLERSRYLMCTIAISVYPIFKEFGCFVSICFYHIRIPHELEGLCV